MTERLATPVQTFKGLDQSVNSITAPDGVTDDCLNVDFHPYGTVKSRLGFANWETPDAADLSPIYGLVSRWMYAEGGGTITPGDYMICLGATKLWYSLVGKDITPGWTEETYPGDDPGETQWVSVETFYGSYGSDILYLANGVTKPMMLTGYGLLILGLHEMTDGQYESEGYALAGVPASDSGEDEWRDWADDPPSGFMIRNQGAGMRMYAWGFEKNRIDYSELDVPWNWLRTDLTTTPAVDGTTDGGYFYAGKSDDNDVVSVRELYDMLLVFKKDKIFIYTGYHDGTGEEGTFALQQTLYSSCASHKSIVQVGKDLYFWSKHGPVSLSGIQAYGDLANVEWGERVKDVITSVPHEYFHKIIAYHEPENFRIIWHLPDDSGSCTHAVCLYYGEPMRMCVWDGGYCDIQDTVVAPSSTTGDDQLYASKSDGRVVELLKGDYDGTNVQQEDIEIDSYLVTKWHFNMTPDQRDRLHMLRLITGNLGGGDIVIKLGTNMSDVYEEMEERAKPLGAGGGWDVSRWDEATWDDTFAGIQSRILERCAHAVRFRFGAKFPWELMGWYLIYSGEGQR